MTESTQPNAPDENNIFINNLIEMPRKDDNELKKFIGHHLFPEKSQLSMEAINNNIKILKGMNCTQQALVKGRAKSFEESNDPLKYFPSLLAIFGFIIGLYALLREITENSWVAVIPSIIVIAVLTIFSSKIFVNTVRRRPTAVFFNTLINESIS